MNDARNNDKKRPCLSIVIPCYNEESVLKDTILQLLSLLDKMEVDNSIAYSSFLLCVNDGSRDSTWDIIQKYHSVDNRVCGVNLAVNVGHQNALIAGLTVASDHSDIMVTIDADLQDNPNVIVEMTQKYLDGADIVYGVRNSRATDSWFKRTTALAFYSLMQNMGVNTIYNHADFRLMSLRAVKQLLKYRERNLFIRGLIPLIGYNTESVYYDRSKRLAGESKYPLTKMLGLALDGITSFSVKPIRFVTYLGIAFVIGASLTLIWVLYEYLNSNVVEGWSSLILSIWFCSGCMLIGLGIIGEYIGKIYTEAKARPRYNIERILM